MFRGYHSLKMFNSYHLSMETENVEEVQPFEEIEQEALDTQEEPSEDLQSQLEEAQARIEELEKKQTEKRKATKKSNKESKKESDEFGLLQKTFLQAAGVSETDEVELAREFHDKYNMEWDELVKDDLFKAKLTSLREERANIKSTSGIRGGQGPSEAKSTPEYWLAKGTPPTREDIPDSKTRRKISRAFLDKSKSSGNLKFYND